MTQLINNTKIRDFLTTTNKQFCFVSISGAHLYGFDSVDSDLDLRGCHIPSQKELLRYSTTKDTYEQMLIESEYYSNELDIVSHSLLKYLHLLCKQPNGYILEQIFSPLNVVTSSIHEELKELSRLTICKEMKFHYGGFLRNQRHLMNKETNKEIKLVLYQLRIMASALYLAKTGKINANLLEVNTEIGLYDQEELAHLVALKTKLEKSNFQDQKQKEYWLETINQTIPKIDEAFDTSSLPNWDAKLIKDKSNAIIEKYLTINWSR